MTDAQAAQIAAGINVWIFWALVLSLVFIVRKQISAVFSVTFDYFCFLHRELKFFGIKKRDAWKQYPRIIWTAMRGKKPTRFILSDVCYFDFGESETKFLVSKHCHWLNSIERTFSAAKNDGLSNLRTLNMQINNYPEGKCTEMVIRVVSLNENISDNVVLVTGLDNSLALRLVMNNIHLFLTTMHHYVPNIMSFGFDTDETDLSYIMGQPFHMMEHEGVRYQMLNFDEARHVKNLNDYK